MNVKSVIGSVRRDSVDEAHWLTVSDLMSGLMIIFLFIAVLYMRMMADERDKVTLERDQVAIDLSRITQVIAAWDETQDAVYASLLEEFKDDLPKWNAEIDRQDLVVRFREPEVLFQRGETALQERFRKILADFFPRYLSRLNGFTNCEPKPDGRPRGCIEEVRIEGHTSSEWTWSTTPEEAYFNNMALSQGRTRSVLQYCQSLPESKGYGWLRERIAAVGFSSSRPIRDANGSEDKDRSRRVEFRVKTTVEKQLMRIIKDD
jgi:outer membrane protein OmpA-like peptidoglycan-associated protein